MNHLQKLLNRYNNAGEIYQAGRYWKAYEDKLVEQVKNAEFDELRSGKYPIFGTFGFSESVFHSSTGLTFYQKLKNKILRKVINSNKIIPYGLKLRDIREMAYHHCEVEGRLSNAVAISEIEASSFGNPADIFEIKGKKYTMQFLSFYLRYCFFIRNIKLTGSEVIVELGSGSGFQLEILKKIYPNLTILCFDLPVPLYLCENYLSNVLGHGSVVSSNDLIDAENLNQVIQTGKIHMFGNWQIPLLQEFKFDIFWNAASFGEMEPHIVENYLKYIKGNCDLIYLLQAKKGKESSKREGVEKPITFEDYNKMLAGYKIKAEAEVYQAHRKLNYSGGYFQAIWEKG